MNATKPSRPPTHAIPVYEVRLVQSRRPLRLAEECIADARGAARALHALIGLTDREHLACLFVNRNNGITGAHIAAVGAQHLIGAVYIPGPESHKRPKNGAAVPLHGGPPNVYSLRVHPSYDGSPTRVSIDVHDLDEETALQVLAIIARSQPTT